MDQKPSSTFRVFGWVIAVLVFLGSYFKINHWPGANILLLLSPFFLLFFYLPLWLGAAWKEKSERFFVAVQFGFLYLFVIWQLLKFQHWPGGALLGNLLFWGAIFILTPVSFFKLYRFGKRSVFQFNNLVILFFLITTMQANLMRVSDTSVGAGSIKLSCNKAETSFSKIKAKSKYLYSAFDQVEGKEQNSGYQKSQSLKRYTESVGKYLHECKTRLIKALEDYRHDVDFDTLSIAAVNNRVDTKIPTFLFVGADYRKPISGKYSGAALKMVIDSYKDSVMKYVGAEKKTILESGINLNTDDAPDESGENQTWVTANFYGVPAITVLITLTNLEYEIKNTETLILTELLNNTAAGSGGSFAARVADLGYELETEKKNFEIVKLQKDKDSSQLRINSKNAEIADRDSTIVIFILISLAFVVMVFFIIRSNILRRQINKQLLGQKEEIEKQKSFIEEKNHEIIDSITYAKRLQQAILPTVAAINEQFPESFVYYQPKDIVAGDFYWMHRSDQSASRKTAQGLEERQHETHSKPDTDITSHFVYLAAADCTGHGVPGAMVSVVCSNALNRAVNEFNLTDTGSILDKTRELVIDTFEKSDSDVKDGMDISLLRIETSTRADNEKLIHVEWSGANNSLWYIAPSEDPTIPAELTELKADKQPIGKYSDPRPFTTHRIPMKEGRSASFYLFSDGYADQFSPDDKKVMRRKFKDIVLSNQHLSMHQQHEQLAAFHTTWKGPMEQTDDVLVIGIRI